MIKILEKENRLREIEQRILEIKRTIGDEERRKAMARGVAMSGFEGRLAKENRPLLAELENLETERKFIIDERNNVFWRVIWNAVVPIIVSFITAYLVTHFLT